MCWDIAAEEARMPPLLRLRGTTCTAAAAIAVAAADVVPPPPRPAADVFHVYKTAINAT